MAPLINPSGRLLIDFEGQLLFLFSEKMDLLNKDLHLLTRNLKSTVVSVFRQDPKLAEAIDKLYYRNHLKPSETKQSGVVLPERKLQFHEVQDLLKLSLNGKEN